MEERTYISSVDLYDLINNVGKCKCYDDAQNLLNSFVFDNIGKAYEAEDGKMYRNSRNTKDIKREVLSQLDNFIDDRELKDKVSESNIEYAKERIKVCGGIKINEKVNIKLLDSANIENVFGKIQLELKKAVRYIEVWRKEAAPLKEKKLQRLRPIKGKEYYIDIMFERLKALGFLAKDENKNAWNYLCGISDDVPEKTMEWKGSFFDFCVLYDFFLVSVRKSYFKYNNGVRGFVVAQFGYNYENGFKQQLSRDYTKKEETIKREAWYQMKVTQMI